MKVILLSNKEMRNECDSLFLISEGVVSVSVDMEEHTNFELSRIGAGNFFGELALLTGKKRSATILALTDTSLFEISKDIITEFITNQPEVAKKLSNALKNRMKSTQKKKEKFTNLHNIDQYPEKRSNTYFKKLIRFFG